MAKEESDRLNDEFISVEHIFVAAVRETQGVTSVLLKRFGIEQEKVYSALMQVRGNHRVDDPRAESKYGSLEKYSIDLTRLAKDGKLDPVIGRNAEIRRVMQTLTRRKKNNRPALLMPITSLIGRERVRIWPHFPGYLNARSFVWKYSYVSVICMVRGKNYISAAR